MGDLNQGSTPSGQATDNASENINPNANTLDEILGSEIKDNEPNLGKDVSEKSDKKQSEKQSAEPKAKEVVNDEIKPRADFDAEETEYFNSLDDNGKKNMLSKWKKLEGGFNKRFESLANERKIAEAINALYKPYENELKVAGITPTQYTERLLAADRFSRENPVGFLQWFAKNYGVNLAELSQSPDNQEQDPVAQELQSVRGEISTLKQELAQREMGSLARQVEDFRNSKDAEGNLKYPMFDEVREQMASINKATGEIDLKVLYDKAIRLNDNAYQKQIEQEVERKIAERQKQLDLEKAKKSSTSLKSSPNAVAARPVSTDLDDILREELK